MCRNFRYIVLLILLPFAFMLACQRHDDDLVETRHGTSLQTTASPELSAIDSLMWRQPDSALACLIPYFDTCCRDAKFCISTTTAYNRHYAHLLLAELLFKNDYAQTNRKELLQAVAHFDSLCGCRDGVHTVSTDPTIAFLDARAHYINGVGYYEHDSLTEACTEYLNTLRIMESHFADNELVGHKARFMALTYGRLLELFSAQFMQEPAIYCGKHSLAYDKIARNSPDKIANSLYHLGRQYDKLGERDSANYYYEASLRTLPDRGNLLYRDVVSTMAFLAFNHYHDTIAAMDSLKNMARVAETDFEMYSRYLTIGSIYHSIGQPDSAKVYLEPVLTFEKNDLRKRLAAKVLHNIAFSEGDTLKADQYAQFLVEDAASTPEKQMRVSQLNDLFQNYLQEKQEAASLREQRKAVRTTLAVVLPLVIVLAAVVVILTRRRSKKRLVAQEAEAQRRLDEASQRLSEAAQRHDEAERELQTKVEQAAQHTREMLQQHITDIYQSNSKDRMQRIREAIDNTYPQAVTRLKAEHPELSETELNVLLLNSLHFRIKEEADLLGLSENTVGKYRSNLGKTLGKDPISDLIE